MSPLITHKAFRKAEQILDYLGDERARPAKFDDIRPFIPKRRFELISHAIKLSAACSRAECSKAKGKSQREKALSAFGVLAEGKRTVDSDAAGECYNRTIGRLSRKGIFFNSKGAAILLFKPELDVLGTRFGIWFSAKARGSTIEVLGLHNPFMHPPMMLELGSNVARVRRMLQGDAITRANSFFNSGKEQRRSLAAEIDDEDMGYAVQEMLAAYALGMHLESRPGESNPEEDYLDLVNSQLRNTAVHEAAHHLISKAGKAVRDKLYPQREWYVQLFAGIYSNILTQAFELSCILVQKAGWGHQDFPVDVNRIPIIPAHSTDELAGMVRERLDQDLVQAVGMRHDQLVPVDELRKVGTYQFIGPEHLPLIRALKPFYH